MRGHRESGPLPPDAIISDLRMPVMDGHEMIRRLRADDRTRRIPIIACTRTSASPATLMNYGSKSGDFLAARRFRASDRGRASSAPRPIDPHFVSSRLACNDVTRRPVAPVREYLSSFLSQA